MSKVYFTNLRTKPNDNLLDKLERLVRRAGMMSIAFDKQFVALKIHFGETGNMAYLRPNYAARLVSVIRKAGGKPFLTDSNTLYSGYRNNAVDHLECAVANGYNPLSTGANVIIADGLKGTSFREIDLGGKYCPKPKIGAAVADADIVISLNHFKGHEMVGFGGALKNLGMGSASVGGKLELHAASKPYIDTQACRGCGVCARYCAQQAIAIVDRKASIDHAKCVGFGQCVALCQFEAAVVNQDETSERLNYTIAEYAQAVVKDKPNFHINFIMNVSPDCDCWGHNDAAVVPDLGIMASFDPVALDMASADLVNNTPILHTHNRLSDKFPDDDLRGQDKFHLIHPDTDWLAGLQYAEQIGLGSMSYDLIEV